MRMQLDLDKQRGFFANLLCELSLTIVLAFARICMDGAFAAHLTSRTPESLQTIDGQCRLSFHDCCELARGLGSQPFTWWCKDKDTRCVPDAPATSLTWP
jgi:hypothetical protein